MEKEAAIVARSGAEDEIRSMPQTTPVSVLQS